jgi:hypothetical protein
VPGSTIGSWTMLDLVLLALGVGSFLLMARYLVWCERA